MVSQQEGADDPSPHIKVGSVLHPNMCRVRRNALLLDNLPLNPPDIQLTNVKVVFFPANTTSKLDAVSLSVNKIKRKLSLVVSESLVLALMTVTTFPYLSYLTCRSQNLKDMLRTVQTDLKYHNAMSAEEFEAIDSNILVHSISDLSDNWDKRTY